MDIIHKAATIIPCIILTPENVELDPKTVEAGLLWGQAQNIMFFQNILFYILAYIYFYFQDLNREDYQRKEVCMVMLILSYHDDIFTRPS